MCKPESILHSERNVPGKRNGMIDGLAIGLAREHYGKVHRRGLPRVPGTRKPTQESPKAQLFIITESSV